MKRHGYGSHLLAGLRILGKRWAAGPRKWVSEAKGTGDTAVRWVLLGGGGYVLFRLLTSSWALLGVTVLIVVLLALRTATKAVAGTPAKAAEESSAGSREQSEEPSSDALPEVSRDAFLALVLDVLGTARAVHLATLATALVHRAGGAWEVVDVRALCGVHGIGVRPKVRDLGGDRVSAGIHRDDLPSPVPLTDDIVRLAVADYAAGQGGNATGLQPDYATPPTPTDRRVGDLRIVAQDDPGNPARTTVTVIDRTRKRA